MRNLTLLFALLATFTGLAQNDWTKDERNNLYQDYLNVLTNRKDLTQQQKETIALCCLDETSKKYVRKEYAAKIEIEIKRIQSSTLSHCAKMSGIELNESQIEVVQTPETKTSEWTKEDKVRLAKDYGIYLQKYPNLNEEQIERLKLCYVQKTTTDYTKDQYDNLIDLELRQKMLEKSNQCGKENKIELNQTEVVEKPSIMTKDILVGTWRTDHRTTITFNANGTFTKSLSDNIITQRYFRIKEQTAKGEWFLDDKGFLTMNETWIETDVRLIGKPRDYSFKEKGKYQFQSVSKDFFKMLLIEGGSCCTQANEAAVKTTQANKVL